MFASWLAQRYPRNRYECLACEMMTRLGRHWRNPRAVRRHIVKSTECTARLPAVSLQETTSLRLYCGVRPRPGPGLPEARQLAVLRDSRSLRARSGSGKRTRRQNRPDHLPSALGMVQSTGCSVVKPPNKQAAHNAHHRIQLVPWQEERSVTAAGPDQ